MTELAGLFDRDELYDIFKSFAELTGLGVSLRDLDGNDAMSYYKNGGACICRMVGGSNMCVDSVRFSGKKSAELGDPYIFTCGCGLVMSACAVVLKDELIGAVLCGPAMLWDADEFAIDELEEKTVRTTALTDGDRRKIADNTPKLSCSEMTSASKIIFRLVNYMCRSRSDNLAQRREITEQQAKISVLLSDSKKKCAGESSPGRGGFYTLENEKRLLTSVRLGDRTAARKQLNSVLSEIFLYSGGNLTSIKAKLYELTGFLFRAASEAGAASEELFDAARVSRKLLDDDAGFEELCYCTSVTLEKFLDAIYNGRPNMRGAGYLSSAAAYISEHYTDNITLADAADAVKISSSYLSHLLRDGLGVSFTDYLASVRVEAAKELLKSTGLGVAEVADRVGYGDPNYFTRIFRKITGLSPAQYTRAVQTVVEMLPAARAKKSSDALPPGAKGGKASRILRSSRQSAPGAERSIFILMDNKGIKIMNMTNWLAKLASGKKPMPILSFPSVQLMGVSVFELTHSAELQARGMKLVADRTDAAASVSMMDLSVEAEAFGCTIKAAENEIPTVIGALIADEDEAEALAVPEVGAGRTGMYIEAAAKAKSLITDRPVLAGMIGPFSLAGRLMDVSEIMVNCIAEPDFVNITMRKATDFLIEYAKAYKAAGVDGIVIAEPLSGLLSPSLEAEFAAPYDKELIEAVKSDDFAVIYHNCGPNTPLMTESIYGNGASAYHFGDAVDLSVMLEKMPSDRPVCGNVSPSAQFLNGTPESITAATSALIEKCSAHANFVLSSGCDIPPATPWQNIDAFFAAHRCAAHGVR